MVYFVEFKCYLYGRLKVGRLIGFITFNTITLPAWWFRFFIISFEIVYTKSANINFCMKNVIYTIQPLTSYQSIFKIKKLLEITNAYMTLRWYFFVGSVHQFYFDKKCKMLPPRSFRYWDKYATDFAVTVHSSISSLSYYETFTLAAVHSFHRLPCAQFTSKLLLVNFPKILQSIELTVCNGQEIKYSHDTLPIIGRKFSDQLARHFRIEDFFGAWNCVLVKIRFVFQAKENDDWKLNWRTPLAPKTNYW